MHLTDVAQLERAMVLRSLPEREWLEEFLRSTGYACR